MSLNETSPPAQAAGVNMDARLRLLLGQEWEAAACEPDLHAAPESIDSLPWIPAEVPGTAAGALMRAGRWRPGEPLDFDAEDWWFRTRFDAEPAGDGEEVLLRIGGIATMAEVFLNGTHLLASDSMFQMHTIDVGEVLRSEGNEIAIHCKALGPLLARPRKPRARWRTKLVDGGLRFHRTMLIGRAPGFAPGPAAVGPWRAIELERRRIVAVERLTKLPRLDGDDGLLTLAVQLRTLGEVEIEAVSAVLQGRSGPHHVTLPISALADGSFGTNAEMRIPDVERWWPHTHGEPALHRLSLQISTSKGPVAVDAGSVGFRTLSAGATESHDVERDGIDLHINGVQVFARGGIWTPVDPVGLHCDETTLRAALLQARDAGMNMLRIPGTAIYESALFHDLCDELGLLLWQDFMFANLDYPIGDAGFRATVEREAQAVMAELAGRPSTAVLCGNSEVEQQVAMLGLDPALGRGELFGELLPSVVSGSGSDAIYLPSSPCGGTLPFRPDRGVAHYFGVGAYRRPLEDARRADVRFASECLAFANVPDEESLREMYGTAGVAPPVHDPRWKAGVPRDAGAGWDFDDVRDHYLKLVFGVDPTDLRFSDHERYLELSRAVTGEVMAEVFGEWRRQQSPCGGGIVLSLRDLLPGAGWGLIDALGRPKVAYHHLRRVLQPVAVWTTDEGLGGVRAHVANDRPTHLKATLRAAAYRDRQHRVDQATQEIELGPHTICTVDLEQVLGRFADIGWSYRFGPPSNDLVVVSLEAEADETTRLLSQTMRHPAGMPFAVEPSSRLGIAARLRELQDGGAEICIASARLVYGVRLHVPGFVAEDDAFSVEPGGERVVHLRPLEQGLAPAQGSISAVNLAGRLRITAAGTEC